MALAKQIKYIFLLIILRPLSTWLMTSLVHMDSQKLLKTQLDLWPRKENNWTEFEWGWTAKLNNIPRSSVEGWEWAVALFPLLPLLIYILSHREVRSVSVRRRVCCLHCVLWHSSPSAAEQSRNTRRVHMHILHTETQWQFWHCSAYFFWISVEWLFNTQAAII